MYKLLIADDEPLERTALAQIVGVEFAGRFEIQETENGQAALEASHTFRPDLILMDIQMPDMNGIDTAKEIMQHYPDTKIIMLTGFTSFQFAKECVCIGAMDFLVQAAAADAGVDRVGCVEDKDLEDTNIWANIAKEFIQKNYTKNLTMDDVARQVGFSTYYFSRLFKQSFGVSFVDYLTTLRLEAAKNLLRKAGASVKEVCVQVGYSEPNYFARVFKKELGLTPTEYQKNAGVLQ